MSGAIDRFMEAARAEGLDPDVRRFPEGTKTADDAARAIGCDVGQIVKSLVFMADDRPVMAFTSGANRVDEAKLADDRRRRRASGGRRRRRRGPRPGSRWEARRRSGIPSGSRAWWTTTCSRWEEIWAAAGTPDSVFPLSPADLLRVTGAAPAAFAADRA